STLVLATADHGEGLGDHGEETHGLFVYDAMVRVPVIVRLPGAIPRGGKLRGLISSVDLAPTVLDLLSLPPLPRAQGSSFAREALRVKLGPSPNAAERASDEEEREKLASLGYASAGGSGRARRRGGDPKKLVGQHNAFLRARWLVSKGRNDEARGLIERVLEADPGNPAAPELSGTL